MQPAAHRADRRRARVGVRGQLRHDAVADDGRPPPGRRRARGPTAAPRRSSRRPTPTRPRRRRARGRGRGPGATFTTVVGTRSSSAVTVDHGGDHRSGSSCRRPPARRAGSSVGGVAPRDRAVGGRHQVDDVRVDAPRTRSASAERRGVRRGQLARHRVPVDGDHRGARPGPARRCRCRPRSRGRRPRAAPPASRRAARRAASSGRPACSRASAVRKQDVGVGTEHRPGPGAQPGQLPGGAGVLRRRPRRAAGPGRAAGRRRRPAAAPASRRAAVPSGLAQPAAGRWRRRTGPSGTAPAWRTARVTHRRGPG